MFRCMLYAHVFKRILCVYTDSGVSECCYNSHRFVPPCCISYLLGFPVASEQNRLSWKNKLKMQLTDNAVLSGWSRGAVRAPHTEHCSVLYSVAEAWAYLPHSNFLCPLGVSPGVLLNPRMGRVCLTLLKFFVDISENGMLLFSILCYLAL